MGVSGVVCTVAPTSSVDRSHAKRRRGGEKKRRRKGRAAEIIYPLARDARASREAEVKWDQGANFRSKWK